MTKGFESLLMFSKLKDFWTLAHVFIGQIVFWGLAHAFRGAKDELFFGALAHAFRGPMILDPSSFVQRPRIFRSYLMFSEDLGFLVLWLMFSKDQRFDFNLPEVIHAVQEAETFPSIRSIFKDLALSFARVQSRRTLEWQYKELARVSFVPQAEQSSSQEATKTTILKTILKMKIILTTKSILDTMTSLKRKTMLTTKSICDAMTSLKMKTM
nr:hypothetical protein CFP56_13530 [Quercus suber]